MIVESSLLASAAGQRHGFGTRRGGVSEGIYASLNCGLGSKDDRADVVENRSRLARQLGAAPEMLVTPYQTHSTDVTIATQPWQSKNAPRADAVVTAKPGLTIAVSTADCVPVLFSEPDAKIVGAAHAGWRGALAGILEATIESMEALGADRSRILAAIGPAISQVSYEVGEEFEATFLKADNANSRFFARRDENARPYFNLTGYVEARLRSAGAGDIENLNICTYREEDRFFSYRRSCHREEVDYGRQISAILIS
ncbi:MAG: peptidoglycan editing factor PgeF [Hyphomicrobiaceae bacterium]|nr:peptidoglycan editing factor PgeF [Hyphomicrobiaceae bacterium]